MEQFFFSHLKELLILSLWVTICDGVYTSIDIFIIVYFPNIRFFFLGVSNLIINLLLQETQNQACPCHSRGGGYHLGRQQASATCRCRISKWRFVVFFFLLFFGRYSSSSEDGIPPFLLQIFQLHTHWTVQAIWTDVFVYSGDF